MSIINLQNGNFQIPDKIVFSKDKNYNDILKLVQPNKIWDIQNGYKWIYFDDIEIDKLFFHIGVCFYNDKLFCIDFSFTEKQEKNLTWDNWNEKEEVNRKETYDKWLTKNMGSKRNFEWGKVSAYFDRKAGSSSIVIKYQ
ncbi:hypothetical protein [Pedobacter boryungensis]|uniref:Uncharacterized protein n=1 Tax=Pedobacter boryungensis TaxID=869962 RepID=A0ABX2DEC2_9SPHI|nr:hypothetical protein [Pedobacter boryungensis]NQX32443.1 hypothetical protein [Pedobacter boryungensis]